MKRITRLSSLACALAFAAGFALPALADPHDEDRHHEEEHRDRDHRQFRDPHDFHGRDFAHFSVEERAAWIGGGWHHDFHNGRFGWWWQVGPVWYFYAAPVYPYPTVVPEVEVAAPVVVAPPAYAPPPAAAAVPPPAQAWYYCDNPAGYYPYVQSCGGPWRPVGPPPSGPAYSGPAYSGPAPGAAPPGYVPPGAAPPPGYAPPSGYAPPPGYAPPGGS
jgi:hypothetical protein